MSKSRSARVPSELHSELTEYASLIRALRANHTSDLSAHLANLSRSNSQLSDGLSDEVYDSHENNDFDGDSGSEQGSSEGKGKGKTAVLSKRSSNRQARFTKRSREWDGWTRWPLLPGDVNRPEWNLRDEITYTIMQTQRRECLSESRRSTSENSNSSEIDSSRISSPDSDSRKQEGGDDVTTYHLSSPPSDPSNSEANSFHDVLSDEYESLSSISDPELGDNTHSKALTNYTIHQLKILFSSCAAFLPSEYTKKKPHSWLSVLQVAKTIDFIPPEVLERVEKRLSTLYGNDVIRESSEQGEDGNENELTAKDLQGKKSSASLSDNETPPLLTPDIQNPGQSSTQEDIQRQIVEDIDTTSNLNTVKPRTGRAGRKKKQRDPEIAINERVKLISEWDPFVKKVIDTYNFNETLTRRMQPTVSSDEIGSLKIPERLTPAMRSLVKVVTGTPRLYKSSSIPLSRSQSRRDTLVAECVRDGNWDILGYPHVYVAHIPRKRRSRKLAATNDEVADKEYLQDPETKGKRKRGTTPEGSYVVSASEWTSDEHWES